MSRVRLRPLQSAAAVSLLLLAGKAPAGGLEAWIQSFAQSEFQLKRLQSNAPLPPLAWLNVSNYGSTEFSSFPDDNAPVSLSYEQTAVSQAATVPFLLGTRDAVFVGEWVGWNRFDVDSSVVDDFSVLSVGVPLAWMRQASDAWQVAAFVAPLGHKSSQDNSAWYWEYMGGGFGRYLRSEKISWVFGFFADVSPGDDLYIPYVGAMWTPNERWTVNAIMPWPAVTYAPGKDTFFRFGVSPSGASWSLQPDNREVGLNLDGWDVGVGVEHRLWRSVWGRVEAGIGGLRGLSFQNGKWNGASSELGTAGYVGVGVSFRPK